MHEAQETRWQRKQRNRRIRQGILALRLSRRKVKRAMRWLRNNALR